MANIAIEILCGHEHSVGQNCVQAKKKWLKHEFKLVKRSRGELGWLVIKKGNKNQYKNTMRQSIWQTVLNLLLRYDKTFYILFVQDNDSTARVVTAEQDHDKD